MCFFARFFYKFKEDHLNCSTKDCNIVKDCEKIFKRENIEHLHVCKEFQSVYHDYQSCITEYCKLKKINTKANTDLKECMLHGYWNTSKWLHKGFNKIV